MFSNYQLRSIEDFYTFGCQSVSIPDIFNHLKGKADAHSVIIIISATGYPLLKIGLNIALQGVDAFISNGYIMYLPALSD